MDVSGCVGISVGVHVCLCDVVSGGGVGVGVCAEVGIGVGVFVVGGVAVASCWLLVWCPVLYSFVFQSFLLFGSHQRL